MASKRRLVRTSIGMAALSLVPLLGLTGCEPEIGCETSRYKYDHQTRTPIGTKTWWTAWNEVRYCWSKNYITRVIYTRAWTTTPTPPYTDNGVLQFAWNNESGRGTYFDSVHQFSCFYAGGFSMTMHQHLYPGGSTQNNIVKFRDGPNNTSDC